MRTRAQLVLAGAAMLAVALAPVVLAYLQLGYHGDVAASDGYDAPARNAERLLERAVHEAATGPTRPWAERTAAVTAVRDRLDPHLETLAAARVAEGVAYEVAYNESAARAWADRRCPGGPDREFGACVADRGVVVQERAGETHALAVALDLTATHPRGTARVTLVVRSVTGG